MARARARRRLARNGGRCVHWLEDFWRQISVGRTAGWREIMRCSGALEFCYGKLCLPRFAYSCLLLFRLTVSRAYVWAFKCRIFKEFTRLQTFGDKNVKYFKLTGFPLDFLEIKRKNNRRSSVLLMKVIFQ